MTTKKSDAQTTFVVDVCVQKDRQKSGAQSLQRHKKMKGS